VGISVGTKKMHTFFSFISRAAVQRVVSKISTFC
jgi:hypothetical protein